MVNRITVQCISCRSFCHSILTASGLCLLSLPPLHFLISFAPLPFSLPVLSFTHPSISFFVLFHITFFNGEVGESFATKPGSQLNRFHVANLPGHLHVKRGSGPTAPLLPQAPLSRQQHAKAIPECCIAPDPPVPGVKMEPSNCLSHTERGTQVLNYRVRATLAAEQTQYKGS